MLHAQLNTDGTFGKRVSENRPTVWDDTHKCLPSKLTPEEAAMFRVVPYALTDRPTFDSITQGLREAPEIEVGGIWTQQWEVYPLPAEDVAANLANKKQSDLDSVRSHAQSLIIAKYPLWVQINYANGIYPESGSAAMAADIAAVITESNRLEDIIEADGVPVPNWPVI